MEQLAQAKQAIAPREGPLQAYDQKQIWSYKLKVKSDSDTEDVSDLPSKEAPKAFSANVGPQPPFSSEVYH